MPDGTGCAQCCLQLLQAEGKKDPIQPLGGRAANQHPGEQGRGNSTGLSAATQSLCLPSGSWVNCSMQPRATRAGLGHLPQSITQHQPAQLPAPSPPRQLHFGGYSCFSSQRAPEAPSSMHACREIASSRVQRQEKSSRDRAFGGSQVPGWLCGVSILLQAPHRGPSTHPAAAPTAVPSPAPRACPIAGGSCCRQWVPCWPLPPGFTRAAEQEPGKPQGQAGAAGCKHRVPG